MSNFDLAFSEVIGLEGGYNFDPEDPGGETKWGIAKKFYPQYDIKNLTINQAKQIYWSDYWNRLMLPGVNNQSVAVEVFEQGVNMGRVASIEHTQKSSSMIGIELVIDGFIGPQTISALNILDAQKRSEAFLKCMNGLQFMKYLSIVENNPTQKKFFVGWLRRVEMVKH